MCSQTDDPSQHDESLRGIARTWVDYWTSREGTLNDPIRDQAATELMVRQFRAVLNARGESAHAHRWQPGHYVPPRSPSHMADPGSPGMVLLVCPCGEMEWRSQPSVAAVERRER